MRIAIIGSGIAGNACAYLLGRAHDVTLYERDTRPGGHAHTVDVDTPVGRIAVDTGFIVYNTLNYPLLTALFDEIGVETIASDMSFAVSADGGRFEWAGQQSSPLAILNSVFAMRRHLVDPRFLKMLKDMLRFNREAPADLEAGRLSGLTLADYLARGGYGRAMIDDYLIPMGAAIWSTPVDKMMQFPAENFVAFFANHRLMHWDRPVWRTVKGGSRTYVERLLAGFQGRVCLGRPVRQVRRDRDGVVVTEEAGGSERYDQVVIAAHSDQALAMLADASEDERRILSAVGYRENVAYLHSDPVLMPKRRRAWAAWNFLRDGGRGAAGGEVAITYWMNRLQSLPDTAPLFVSLNPPRAPDPALTHRRFSYAHPQFDQKAFDAQKALGTIQGVNRMHFAGAWCGYGFHEDGLRSAVTVAAAFGITEPFGQAPARLEVAA